jgi:cell wall-associated NlpC family hydrolase
VRLAPASAAVKSQKTDSTQKPRVAPGLSVMTEGTATGIAHAAPSDEIQRYALSIAPSATLRLTAPTTMAAGKKRVVGVPVAGGRKKAPVAPASKSPLKNKPVLASTVKPAPATAHAPRLAVAPVTVGKVPAANVERRPADLSSRHKDRMLLAQLEADLNKSKSSLNRANADLTRGQRQLAAFSDTLRSAMMEAGPDATGLHPFVKVAQRYAGTPYVWGGESGRGFDCSGFIIRVMRDLGYKALPHSAAEQFRYGMPIANELLKPGDLVFFANTYKPGISHVGIYLGRRRFIHAAGTGLGTIVSSLDAPKFRSKYAGARRLVAQ